ncbi:hypothetical protein [uncultured Deefgea sp.]|nr:hypothetical protein [uncultured Deefgea sp.]
MANSLRAALGIIKPRQKECYESTLAKDDDNGELHTTGYCQPAFI